MPYRLLAATELAEFLRALSHPRRIQILEELRRGERDVADLAKATELSHSSVSQHLMVLRAHRVVTERREGRRVFYQLRSEELACLLVGWSKAWTSCRPWINKPMKCAGQSRRHGPNGLNSLAIDVSCGLVFEAAYIRDL